MSGSVIHSIFESILKARGAAWTPASSQYGHAQYVRGLATNNRFPQPQRPQGLNVGGLLLTRRDILVAATALATTIWLYDLIFEENWLRSGSIRNLGAENNTMGGYEENSPAVGTPR